MDTEYREPGPFACQECGNDDAVWFLCSDCLRPGVGLVAAALADTLGGTEADYRDAAEAVVAAIAD